MEYIKQVFKMMGCRFEIGIYGEDKLYINECISFVKNEMSILEDLFSTYKNNSQTNLINSRAGIEAVEVDKRVFELIQYSINISEKTNGLFDITYGSLNDKFWNFDKTMTTFSVEDIDKSNKINYSNIVINQTNCSVYLNDKKAKIGFGGIGKGFAADYGKNIFLTNGLDSGFINASGDITAWGNSPEGESWKIGIKDPLNFSKIILNLKITNRAVATSGNYEKYINVKNELFSHIINPNTGYPIEGMKSTTIIAPSAIYADAIATAASILDAKNGINLINVFDGVSALIIDNNNQYHFSTNFPDFVY